MLVHDVVLPPDTVRWGHREVQRNYYKRTYYSVAYDFIGTVQEFIDAGLTSTVVTN